MNLLIPSSKISRQRFPCPDCHAPIPVDVVTEITSNEDLSDFIALRLNRARCSACGAQVEAPVRVTVRFPDYPAVNHDGVPIALLENPEGIQILRIDYSTDLRDRMVRRDDDIAGGDQLVAIVEAEGNAAFGVDGGDHEGRALDELELQQRPAGVRAARAEGCIDILEDHSLAVGGAEWMRGKGQERTA